MNDLPKENIYGHTKKIRFIIEHIRKYMDMHGKQISVLDFGCGNGTAVSQFLCLDGLRYYGVDIHESSLTYARKHFSNDNASFSSQIPQEVQFDVIIYADVLEHLDVPVFILQQHRAILKENGIIIGSVPNGFGPFENEKRVDKRLGLSTGISLAVHAKRRLLRQKPSQDTLVPYNSDSGHVQFFTKRSLFEVLQHGGFKVECFRNGAFFGAPLSERILRGEWIATLNSRVADSLPYWAVSTWYFVAKNR